MTESASANPPIESRVAVDWDDLTALLIIEPDPETWLPTAQAIGQARLILDEIDRAILAHVDLYPCLWLGAVSDDEGLFGAEGYFTPVHLHGSVTADSELWSFLCDLLMGSLIASPGRLWA